MELEKLLAKLDWCKSYMAEFTANNEFDPYAAIMGTESKSQKLYCECVEYVSDIGKYLAERSEEFNKRRKEIVYGK